LLKGSFQILHDFCRNHIWIWEAGAVFEAFVFEPEDVEVELVALGLGEFKC